VAPWRVSVVPSPTSLRRVRRHIRPSAAAARAPRRRRATGRSV